ncbi:MAG: hypothetical protein RR115_07740 [Hydrogenoanaerobacterium sp.]
MEFNAGTWWLIATLAGLAIAAIAYFLKRTISKVDDHDKDIQTIKQTYATETKVEAHDKDIQLIKQTYITKDEFKDLRTEIKLDLDKISEDMNEMKKNSLSKADFYRAQCDTNDSVKRIFDLLIKMNGGQKHNEQ